MLNTKIIGSWQEYVDFREGYILSSPLDTAIVTLNGKTVIIDAGAGDLTTTFVGTSLTPAQVVAQINAVVAGAAVLRAYDYGASQGTSRVIVFATSTHIIKSTGTANGDLGLSVLANSIPGAVVVTQAQVERIVGDPDVDETAAVLYDDWTAAASTGYNAVLTAAYVPANATAVRVDQLRNIGILLQFTTGATGVTDEWLPDAQIEASSVAAPTANDWFVVNTQFPFAGLVTATRAVYEANGGVMYTAPATVYRDVLTAFENNPGWKWIRVTLRETRTPDNHGTAVITITGSQR